MSCRRWIEAIIAAISCLAADEVDAQPGSKTGVCFVGVPLLVLGCEQPVVPGGPVVEGRLYREAASAEVYQISAGRKIWVPTPDALSLMGFNWSAVTVVPDGTLNQYPRFNIPSAAPTPPSLVFPPSPPRHFPLAVVPNAVKAMSQGKEIQLVELYGWLVAIDPLGACGDGQDFHYSLELDTDSALAQGIDLNRIYRVGNIAAYGLRMAGFGARRAVSMPWIEVELNSWTWQAASYPPRTKPADWTYVGNCNLSFAFDHYEPMPGQRLLHIMPLLPARGPYVRISGSLVTDDPHDVQHRPNVIFSRWLGVPIGHLFVNDGAEWQGAVPDWHPGVPTTSPNHYARWTEIHPPDRIEVLPFKLPRVTVRGVALAARVGALVGGLSNSCEQVEFDIIPEAVRPPNSQIAYEELRGPETFWPWGQNAENGSWITVFDDRIRVKARVCGGAVGGSPGRFKAIYRVWWKPAPAGPTTRTGSFLTTTDRDSITYFVQPNVAASNVVEFRLCLGPGLTWEKRMNMPNGTGSSWNLIVKDNTRCATNSLWALEVLNGQSLTFYKAKLFGEITQVHMMPMSLFAPLPGGTRVTFTWIRD